MSIDVLKLRGHATGAAVVGFVASIATLLMAQMAKVGPQFFEYLMRGLAAVTMLSICAAAILLAIIVFKSKV